MYARSATVSRDAAMRWVARFLEAVAGFRNRVALTTAYAAGLRIREVARLKVASIDGARMLIHVEMGKGGKERYAMLSARLLDVLRIYWRRARPNHWLFPGQEPGSHVSVAALQDACEGFGSSDKSRVVDQKPTLTPAAAETFSRNGLVGSSPPSIF